MSSAELYLSGLGQIVSGIKQLSQNNQGGRRKIFPVLCGYTKTFSVLYDCSTSLCLLSVLTKLNYEPEKKF